MRNIEYQKEYTLIDLLGEGAYGKAYSAKNISTGEKVVLKFMDSENPLVSSEDIKQEFAIKKILGKDCKKNLVCYHDLFSTIFDDKFMYVLVMDFVEGKELFSFLEIEHKERKILLTEKQRYKITQDLINALKIIHSHGLVHRDIKVDNVVYNPEKNQAVLIDYGLTCSLVKFPSVSMCNGGQKGSANTMDITLLAKLSMGLEITDEEWIKNDFYELGVTLFNLWSGANFVVSNFFRKNLRVIPKNIKVLIGKLLTGTFRFSESESFV
jgi:calcium/calmodulin-dependent protein kinase I